MVFLAVSAGFLGVFSGCGSGGYIPPSALPKSFVYNIAGTQDMLASKTIAVLKAMEFETAVEDMGSGLIRTVPKEIRLTTDECDCGMLYNRPFLNNPATTLRLALEIYIQDGSIKFFTTVTAKHLARNGNVDKVAECISTGSFEKQLVDNIIKKQIAP